VRPALALVVLVGCARDPAPAECPDVAVGDLVVTEIRGPQSGADTLGVWVELYSVNAVDLQGVKVRFRKKDGSTETDVIVRRSLPVGAGQYVTLGLFADDDTRPSYIDYGMAGDYHDSFLPAAAIDVEACGVRIDRATYDSLPKLGTYSLGGAPSADSNDLPASWCTNPSAAGTPQQANPACP
jgi:hypothetical protein